VGTPCSFSIFNPERQVAYFALSAIDQGGFGSVWSGITAWGEPVAIKIIKRTANFQRDFSSWSTDQQVHLLCWDHQHVVKTFDQFVSAEGHLVIVMELGGGNLHSLLRQRTMRWSDRDICAIAWQLLSALGQIHAKGIIHRDVTLKNVIWFPGGIFKLCDFGVSKQNVTPGELARTFVGNPGYIPFELLTSGYTTHRSDIYQLGLVLLSLMIGRHPFPENSTLPQIQRMILEGLPRRWAELLIPTHGETAKVLAKMLPRHDAYRYQTAAEAEAAFTSEFWKLENRERFADQFPLLNQQLLRS
jgi:serine/threonine protein kinase